MTIAFPTGKAHVSFSEVRTWAECPWKHKLTYIDKVKADVESEHLYFGTAVHASCEKYLKTRELDTNICTSEIRRIWQEKGFPAVDKWCSWAETTINDIPTFLDENFPEWETLDAEHALMEPIDNHDIKFKGFIDAIFKLKDKRGKSKLLIVDWKTGPAYGWRRDKKEDFNTQAQLILYKWFIMKKFELASADVGTAFVVLKKGAKSGKSIDLVAFSAGPKAQEKANKLVSNMINTVKRGFFPKNKHNCQFCDFAKSGQCVR